MVRFLSRPGCHICEEVLPLVKEEVLRSGHELAVINVEDDEDLLSMFVLRIPVVLGPDSDVLAEGQIERRALRRALKRAGARGRPRGPNPR